MPPRHHQSQLSFLTDDQSTPETSKGRMKAGRNVDNGNLSETVASKSKRTKTSRAGIKAGGNNSLSLGANRNSKTVLSHEPGSGVERDGDSSRSGKKGRSKSDTIARAPKERLTVHLSVELINRIRNVVYWTPGLTLADLGEDAFTRIVAEREKKRGAAFPQRKEELKGGRPLK